MSKEGDRAAVFRTTKVRTKLKGDASWLQRREEPQAETLEEKPWVAEVRASRLNGAPIETSPVSSPTKSIPPPTKSDAESKAPTSGYLIRGIFTKLDNPAPTSTSNGISKTTQFTKKPSESYKRIAPHTVRPPAESQEGQLSLEEHEKRTEAASNVLKRSAVKQRSYVLSAAKKYEAIEASPDAPLVNSSPSFVAKRVEITDDEDSSVTPAPASAAPPASVVPVTSAAPAPEPKPRTAGIASVETAADLPVDEPGQPPKVDSEAPKMEEALQEFVKEDLLPQSVTEKDPPECVKSVSTVQHLDDSSTSEQADTSLLKPLPASNTPSSPESPSLDSTIPESPDPAPRPASSPSPAASLPVSLDQVSAVTEVTVKAELELGPEPEPEPVESESETEPEPEPEPETEPESKPSQEISSSVDTLAALSDTLISFDTSATSVKDDQPELAKEEGGSVDSHTSENSAEQGPAPVLTNGEPITEDLLGFSDGPEESAEPVPPSPGRWSQDLLGALDSESNQTKTDGPQDLLTSDAIISTETNSMQREEEKMTDETVEDTQSQDDNVDPWSSHVTTTVTESSSTDPFDPYPIGTTSHNRSPDLLQPLSNISINSSPPPSEENKSLNQEIIMNSNTLESLADDIIPIDTDTKSLSSRRSWIRTWDTDPPEQTYAEDSQEAEPGAEGQAEDQQTVIMFERKSTENDSPWDRWTSPTVYTITTTTGEEEEEEEEEEEDESPEDIQAVSTVTTITIRETESEPEPAMDRSVTYSTTVVEEEQHAPTPEPEPKKGFVFVKEYVNATELSLHNPKDTTDGGTDYLTSSSVSYSSSPSSHSRGSLTSTCTYCGEQVGNDAKITIEHLSINCHPSCFKCDVCSKPMGDLLYSMFIHAGKVHCESCYSNVI